jgi:Cu/Zn superoxide dismutase
MEAPVMTTFLRTLIASLTVFLSASTAWAQLSTAQVSGRITTKAARTLPGVTVTVTQTDTGLARSVVTNESGAYVLPNCRPVHIVSRHRCRVSARSRGRALSAGGRDNPLSMWCWRSVSAGDRLRRGGRTDR